MGDLLAKLLAKTVPWHKPSPASNDVEISARSAGTPRSPEGTAHGSVHNGSQHNGSQHQNGSTRAGSLGWGQAGRAASEEGSRASGRGASGPKKLSSAVQIAAPTSDSYLASLVILPNDTRLLYWWYLTVLLACVTGWTELFEACFLPLPGLAPYNDFWAAISYVAAFVFWSDLVLHFFLAYHDRKANVLITDLHLISRHYLRGMFWVDFVAIFPFTECVLDGLGLRWSTGILAHYVGLLKILSLLRLYRLFEYFAFLEYNMTFGQILLMLFRNNTYVMYVTHWAACVYYLIASQEHFRDGSWVGRNFERRFAGRSLAVRYIYSLYTSMSTFSGMGDGDFYAASPAESLFVICYLLFNLVMAAYILGTVTMLVVKSDKRSKVYRDRVFNLLQYSQLHSIPTEVHDSMKEHLELHFNSEQASDDQVLAIYPSTIRRKVLRHLYLEPVRSCYLMRGCKQKFLDAFMASSRVELFMPQVHILAEGDVVNELFIVVSGTAETMKASAAGTTLGGHALNVDGSMHGSAHGGSLHSASFGVAGSASFSAHNGAAPSGGGSSHGGDNSLHGGLRTGNVVLLGTSEPFGEIPFFTEIPSPENVWSVTVCRVLVLSRSAYEGLQINFPHQMRMLLENVQRRAEDVMKQEITMAAKTNQITESQKARLTDYSVARQSSGISESNMIEHMKEALTPQQQAALHHLKEIQNLVRQYCVKVDQKNTNDFLNAASRGDEDLVRRFLNQGLSVNSADYDHRTALMLAAQKGNEVVVNALLESGADHSARDSFGNTAMFEACKAGHDKIIDSLLLKGARLNMDGIMVAAQMCTCVFEGDLTLMRRLLRAGADPDAADYDKRCALHISAAEGNLTAVKGIVEEGNATVGFQDRWGNTALDEALRVGAHGVVAYLEPLMREQENLDSVAKWKQQRTQRFLQACSTGDVEVIKYMLERNNPPTIVTGMMVAASKGHKAAVQALLAWGGAPSLRQEVGHAMLFEAALEGNDEVLDIVLAHGSSLKSRTSPALGAQLCSTAREGDVKQMVRLLRIGISPDVPNADRATALHTAAGEGSIEMVRVLVEDGGASLSLEDVQGSTAASAARRAGFTQVAEYLEWAAAQPGGRPNKDVARQRWGEQRPAPLPRHVLTGALGAVSMNLWDDVPGSTVPEPCDPDPLLSPPPPPSMLAASGGWTGSDNPASPLPSGGSVSQVKPFASEGSAVLLLPDAKGSGMLLPPRSTTPSQAPAAAVATSSSGRFAGGAMQHCPSAREAASLVAAAATIAAVTARMDSEAAQGTPAVWPLLALPSPGLTTSTIASSALLKTTGSFRPGASPKSPPPSGPPRGLESAGGAVSRVPSTTRPADGGMSPALKASGHKQSGDLADLRELETLLHDMDPAAKKPFIRS